MKKLTTALILAAALALPTTAFAYVGPGAGLSLLGALWALIAAVGAALLFIIAWPVHKMLRRRRAARAAARGDRQSADGMASGTTGQVRSS